MIADTEKLLSLSGHDLKCIVKRCSPRLERLWVKLGKDSDFALFSHVLDKSYTFPNMKSLSLSDLDTGTMMSLQSVLYSMTKLETLILYKIIHICDHHDAPGFINVPDLKILAQAPFRENLTDLKLNLWCPEDHESSDPAFTAPLTSLLQRAGNLKILRIADGPNWDCTNDAPLTY